MPVYLSLSSTMLALPLGSIRGSSSPSPRMAASSSRVSSTSRMWSPGLVAGGPGARRRRRRGRWGADVAGPLADAAGVLRAVAELRQVDLRQGDRHVVSPGLADHLALGDIFAQVALDLTPDDLLESALVALDFSDHGWLSSGAAGIRANAPRGPRAQQAMPAPSAVCQGLQIKDRGKADGRVRIGKGRHRRRPGGARDPRDSP